MAKRLRGRVITSSPVNVCKAKSKTHGSGRRLGIKTAQKAVTFLVDRDKELKEVREVRVPTASSAKSLAENLPGRSKAEWGKKEEKTKRRYNRNELMHAIPTAGPTESTARSDDATAVEERNAERSSGGDVAKEPFSAGGPKLGLLADGRRA